MYKRTKYFFLLCVMTLLSFTLCGCFENPKNFTEGELTITLTDEFVKSSVKNFDVYISSEAVAFSAVKEDASSLEYAGYEINSLTDYSHEILALNGVSQSDLVKRGSYNYFVNESKVSNTSYTYVHCMFQTANAYWICEFVCKSGDYDRYSEKILQWADSIQIK